VVDKKVKRWMEIDGSWWFTRKWGGEGEEGVVEEKIIDVIFVVLISL